MAPEEPPPEPAPREPGRRLFFALWPDEAMRQAMARATQGARRASGGQPVPPENLHVTLAFLGSVAERRMADLGGIALAAAREPAGAPLELAFDHLEYWRAAQLLCAAPAGPSPPAAALAARLQARLAQSGFAPDLKPFRPHVTVVRKVARPGPVGSMEPVLWRFEALALVESRTLPTGALYSVVESHALCSGHNGAK
jgi:2'-5' RNA ligase